MGGINDPLVLLLLGKKYLGMQLFISINFLKTTLTENWVLLPKGQFVSDVGNVHLDEAFADWNSYFISGPGLKSTIVFFPVTR